MSRRISSTRVALTAIAAFALANIFSGGLFEKHIPDPGAVFAAHKTQIGGAVIINEVDSDQASTDTAEFIELYDGGIGNMPLDGYVVVFFNGAAANDASYAAFDLDGFTTNAGGYFTLGNSAVPGVDRIFPNNTLQNGPDAVAVFSGDSTDFPNATPITTVNLLDAVVYNNATVIDSGLLVLLNTGQLQVNENGLGNGPTVSMQRLPNGSGGERNTASYQVQMPTPDAPNFGPTITSVSLSGRVTTAFGNGLRGARMTLEGGGMSEPRQTATSSFGYYRFDGLAPGVYILTINSKQHTFAVPTRMVMMSDNITDFDFVAEPEE